MNKEEIMKTRQIRMFNQINLVVRHIHRRCPNFEIGSLVGRNN